MFYSLSDNALQLVQLLAVVIIPTLVAMITRRNAARWLKSLCMVALNTLAAICTAILDVGGFTAFGILFLAVQSVAVSAALYYGVLKPTGLAGKDSKPAEAVPGFLGGSRGEPS